MKKPWACWNDSLSDFVLPHRQFFRVA